MLTETESQRIDGYIGKKIEEVETPALVVDLDILERNMDKMMEFLSHSSVGLRPHAKTHKTPPIARMQIEKGAVGITCATVGEAEVLVDGGIKDVLITNRVVGHGKIERAVSLAKRATVRVAVDSEENLKALSDASVLAGAKIGIIVEADINQGRAGVRSTEQAIGLAKLAAQLPGVTYDGLMGYEGHCVFLPTLEERKIEAGKAYEKLFRYKSALSDAGFAPQIVSSAGTGTYLLAGRQEEITDIQAGSYIFMDARYSDIEGIDFEQALTVLSAIVSHPEPKVFVCDAGIKSMSEEFGQVLALPSYGLGVKGMSEEYITLFAADKGEVKPYIKALDQIYGRKAKDIGLGTKVHLIPSHCCTTVNLHDVLYVTRNGVVQNVWRVAGRGRFA